MAPQAATVMLAGVTSTEGWARITGGNPDELLAALADQTDPSNLVAVVDAPCEDGAPDLTGDQVIALSAVLAQRGVRAIETRYVVAVSRVFATYQAIQVGQV